MVCIYFPGRSPLRCHHDNALRGARTVDSGRRGILQNRNAFYFRGVYDILQIGSGCYDTIQHYQRAKIGVARIVET